MISGTTANSCFPSGAQGLSIYGVSEDVVSSNIDQQQSTAATDSAAPDPHSVSSTNFLYNLSVLKDKVQQVQSFASMFISSDHSQPTQSTAMAIAIASMGTLIQEIIVTASSMMFTCQQITVGVGGSAAPSSGNNHSTKNSHQLQQQHPHHDHHHRLKLPDGPGAVVHGQNGGGCNRVSHFGEERGQGMFYSNSDSLDHWYGDSYNNCSNANDNTTTRASSVTVVSNQNEVERGEFSGPKGQKTEGLGRFSPKNYDIVELDAADLLAKYTHYCQVCGKGFKRDANLRMHMRAHGDEYKSSAALSNPHKNGSGGNGTEEGGLPKLPRKYSCPHEGCRWNKKHAKFQPLKSMICVKNHYKRSHCPKMYVCKRCNRKQFSVLSDLRTHEKHCGDLKWQCSCGTTFSRKDKLMGHVALFVGHTPALSSLAKMGKADPNAGQVQLKDR